jgi:hypothetical protein
MTVHDGASSLLFVDEIHAIASALMGGARYGVKIRLPHALLMTVLFRKDLTTRDKIKTVLTLVYEHASNLAAFATIYKVMLLQLKYLSRLLRSMPAAYSQNSIWKLVGRRLLDLIGMYTKVEDASKRNAQKKSYRHLSSHSSSLSCFIVLESQWTVPLWPVIRILLRPSHSILTSQHHI